MLDLAQELLDFRQREITVKLEDLFPRIDRNKILEQYKSFNTTPDETVYRVAVELANSGYAHFLEQFGFWQKECEAFECHCHQCTPVLGAILRVLGFDVSYLECYRVREQVAETGKLEQVPPDQEPDPVMKHDFCAIKRIPYCCLEVMIDGQPQYVTAKHIKAQGTVVTAALTAQCYARSEASSVFCHQNDATKSGVYLQPVVPAQNPGVVDFAKFVVWRKQTFKDFARTSVPECFATFLRMKLV